MNAADLMTSFLPPRDRPDVRSGGKRLGDNPPLVLVRPRPPSTDAGDHLKPADAHHPLRFECRMKLRTNRSPKSVEIVVRRAAPQNVRSPHRCTAYL